MTYPKCIMRCVLERTLLLVGIEAVTISPLAEYRGPAYKVPNNLILVPNAMPPSCAYEPIFAKNTGESR